MARRDLLPGVTLDSCPPPVVVDSRATVRRARRRAAVRDAVNILLIAIVGTMAIRWPQAHVPLLSRDTSMIVVAVVTAAVITHVIFSRLSARWKARRIATTWSLRERARFFDDGRL